MQAFVTGGSGFIGQHLIQQLVAKGYAVKALARSAQSAAIVSEAGATAVSGDISNKESMRAGMAGSDVVFHLAAWYKMGATDWAVAEEMNVAGTRNVLRLAVELNIPKIVYTSTVAVFGDTQGVLADENYYSGGPFLTEYDRTKWLAHYKVALPLIEKGAPIIIVMPGGVYGPGDTSVLADMMRLFYRGLPALPGPETTLTYAHVADVAAGHILAAENGRIGESYILAGPPLTLREAVDLWASVTGRPAPQLGIPAFLLRPSASLMTALGQWLPIPPAFSGEATATLGATYKAQSTKAFRELGWQIRPLRQGIAETFAWITQTERDEPLIPMNLVGFVLGGLAALLLFNQLRRRKQA